MGERPFGARVDLERPLDLGGEGDPQLACRQRPGVRIERGADRRLAGIASPSRTAGDGASRTFGAAARAITLRMPDHDAIRAAVSLLAMPPLPRPLPSPSAAIANSGSSAVDPGDEPGRGSRRGSAV